MKALYLRQRVWIWCIKYLLRQHSHQSRVSNDDLATVDTYWIYFKSSDSSYIEQVEDRQAEATPDKLTKFHIEPLSKKDNELSGRQVRKDSGDPEKPKFRIEASTLNGVSFEIRHFFREIETTFDSPTVAFWWRLFRLHWGALLFNRLLGKWYYRNVKLVNDRATVLRSVIKQEDERSMYISVMTVVNDIYGDRYNRVHPSRRIKVHDTVHRVLQSLVHSGELTRVEARFRTTGKCLASLSEWETDLRRHRHQKIQEVLMLMVTIVIAIGTILQAIK